MHKIKLSSGIKVKSDFLSTRPVVEEGSMTPSKLENLSAHSGVIPQDCVSPISDLTLHVHHSSPP